MTQTFPRPRGHRELRRDPEPQGLASGAAREFQDAALMARGIRHGDLARVLEQLSRRVAQLLLQGLPDVRGLRCLG